MKIKLTDETKKAIAKQTYYNEDNFIDEAKSYIKAVESGRILYNVTSVSSSGMSRVISIKAFEGKYSKGYYRTFYSMLCVLGYKSQNDNKLDNDEIRVSGCGMNMRFATNYNIIRTLARMGFMNTTKRDILAQKVN